MINVNCSIAHHSATKCVFWQCDANFLPCVHKLNILITLLPCL
jgi:hypothetical protein